MEECFNCNVCKKAIGETSFTEKGGMPVHT